MPLQAKVALLTFLTASYLKLQNNKVETMSIHSVQMVMSGITQLQGATITQRPANTCFLLKQKQPDQPLCI